jgi:aryl-alcohol dehydrogenase-like predicted oxidoreductase
MRELGIGLVPFSPMGRGFLTGAIRDPDKLDASDWRRNNPRFQAENLEHNLGLVEMVKEIASAHNVTPAQVALAWILRQGKDIVPIPGTTHVRHLEENAKAADLDLPGNTWSVIDKAVASFRTAGERYLDSQMHLIDRSE